MFHKYLKMTEKEEELDIVKDEVKIVMNNVDDIIECTGKLCMELVSLKRKLTLKDTSDSFQTNLLLAYKLLKSYKEIKNDIMGETFDIPYLKTDDNKKHLTTKSSSLSSLSSEERPETNSDDNDSDSSSSESDTASTSTSDEYDFGEKDSDIEKAVNIVMANAMITRNRERQSIQHIYIRKNI